MRGQGRNIVNKEIEKIEECNRALRIGMGIVRDYNFRCVLCVPLQIVLDSGPPCVRIRFRFKEGVLSALVLRHAGISRP